MRIKLTKRILRTLHTAGIALLSAAAGTMIAAVLSLPADYVLSRTLQKSYLTSCLARIDEKRLSSPDLSSLSLCPGTGYLVFRPSDGSEPKTAGNPEAHGPISVSRETSGGTAELFSASGGPDLIQVTMFSSGSAPFWGLAATLSLIIFLAGGSYLDIFPLGGLTSDDFEEFSLFGKIADSGHHLVLPIFCYMIGEFAFLTFLMKNSALEELGKDYMRTALAKGMNFNQALVRHALRNALIPIATRLSEICTLMFAGALLIEKVFDIDGMGLLYYNSMVNRDYNVVMGIIFLSSLMAMVGRLFSYILYTLVDPRIKFS